MHVQPDSLSTLYCQTAPRNAELNGLFNCQFAGVNPTVFTGNVQVGAAGTIPFGLNAPVNPPGACPASATAVPDGQQLEQLVQSPGTGKQVDTYVLLCSYSRAPGAHACIALYLAHRLRSRLTLHRLLPLPSSTPRRHRPLRSPLPLRPRIRSRSRFRTDRTRRLSMPNSPP